MRNVARKIRNFFKLVKSQLGSSLLEVLAAMAISGIVSLAIMQMGENAQKSMTQTETDAALRLFLNGQLRPLLADSNSCRRTFHSSVITNATTSTNITDLYRSENGTTGTVVFSTTAPQDRWDAGNQREFVAANSWSLTTLRYRGFQSSNNAADLTLGKCWLDVTVTRERRTATGKMFSFGPAEKTIPIEMFCKTTTAATPTIETCNAISNDDSDIWIKREVTAGGWRTYINYNGNRDDHVIIGTPPETSPGVLDSSKYPLAPLNIYEDETPWYFPVFSTGVAIPKDGVYTFRKNEPNESEWGITEIGDSSYSCLNFLAYNTTDTAVFPYVKHCRNDSTSTENNDLSLMKNTVQVEDGNVEVIYGNVVFSDSTINDFNLPNYPTGSATKVSNSTALGSSNIVNFFNSTALGSGNVIARDSSKAISESPVDILFSSHAVGRDNTLYGRNHIALGDLNKIDMYQDGYAMGFQNSISTPYTSTTASNMAVGERNQLSSEFNYVLGSYNYAAGYDYVFGAGNVSLSPSSYNVLIGRNNYVPSTISSTFLMSANGPGVNDLSSFAAEENNEVAFHAENGHRFFTMNAANNSYLESLRIAHNGAFNHGNLKSGTTIKSEYSTSATLSVNGADVLAPFSMIISSGRTGVMANPKIWDNSQSTANHVIVGSKDSFITPSKVGNGVYFSHQAIISNWAKTDWGYGQVIMASGVNPGDSYSTGSSASISDARGNNFILASSDADITDSFASTDVPANGMLNNGIIASYDASMSRGIAIDGHFADNVIYGYHQGGMSSKAMTTNSSYPADNGVVRNALFQSGALEGSYDNFIVGGANEPYLENSGGSCVLNSGVEVYSGDSISEGPASYGNTFINSFAKAYTTAIPDVKSGSARVYDNSSFNLLVNVSNVNLGNSAVGGGSSYQPVIGTAVFSGNGTADQANLNSSTDSNKFIARFNSGYRFYTRSATSSFSSSYSATDRGTYLNYNQSSWNALSDVNTKENFQDPDEEVFVARYMSMPVMEWDWKGKSFEKELNIDGKEVRHISPFAEDYKIAFGNADTDGKRISYFRLGGINMKMAELKAKQAINQESQIKSLKQRFLDIIEELKELVASLTNLVNDLLKDDNEINDLEKDINSAIKERKRLVKLDSRKRKVGSVK